VGTAIRFAIRSDEASAVALRRELEVPTGKNTFAFADVGIAAGADEGKLGELVGILEGLLTALGAALNEKAGIPLYHGHNVKVAKDRDGSRVLRVAFFAEMNPTELAAAQLGRDPSVFSPAGLLDLRIALETPLSLALLKDDDARLSLDRLRGRFNIEGSVSANLDRRAREVVTGLPGMDEKKADLVAAGARFFKGLNVDLQTISLDELRTKFTTPFDDARQPHEALRQFGDMLPGIPLKAAIGGQLMALSGIVSEMPPEVQTIYSAVRANLTGPKRVHLQVEDAEFELSFVGFDIFQFAPPIGGTE